MQPTAENQVIRVRKLSALARTGCSIVFALLTAYLATQFLVVAKTDFPAGGTGFIAVSDHVILAETITMPTTKFWLLTLSLAEISLPLAIVCLLRGVFARMANGVVFDLANANAVSKIALGFAGIGLLRLGLPPLTAALTDGHFTLDFVEILEPFAVAAIIHIASWIMRIGLGVTGEAERLQRDADLVV